MFRARFQILREKSSILFFWTCFRRSWRSWRRRKVCRALQKQTGQIYHEASASRPVVRGEQGYAMLYRSLLDDVLHDVIYHRSRRKCPVHSRNYGQYSSTQSRSQWLRTWGSSTSSTSHAQALSTERPFVALTYHLHTMRNQDAPTKESVDHSASTQAKPFIGVI